MNARSLTSRPNGPGPVGLVSHLLSLDRKESNVRNFALPRPSGEPIKSISSVLGDVLDIPRFNRVRKQEPSMLTDIDARNDRDSLCEQWRLKIRPSGSVPTGNKGIAEGIKTPCAKTADRTFPLSSMRPAPRTHTRFGPGITSLLANSRSGQSY